MQKQKKILFLHGFYASGSCVPALALKEAFEKRATVLTPDLPLHPADAVRLIREICDQEKPDILVGNSCGSFYAQMISPIIGVPALLGNPHFKMSDFLRERIGNHQYKSPRADGRQDFTIDELLEITQRRVKCFDYQFTTTAWEKYSGMLSQAYQVRDPESWGNARFVGNLLERIYIQHAARCVRQQPQDKQQLRLITPEDIVPIEMPRPKAKIGF